MKRVISIITRLWTLFCFLSVCTSLPFLVFGSDDPWRSDDPYLYGFLVAGILSFVSLPAVIAREFSQGFKTSMKVHFAVLAACAGALFIWDRFFPPPEGQGFPALLAFITCGGGVAIFPFLVSSNRKEIVILASVLGLLLLIGYCIARTNMAT